VLRYYRGIGAEPTKEELDSALNAAYELLLSDVSFSQLSSLVNEAVERHEGAQLVPFSVAVSYTLRARAEQAAENDRKKGTGLMTAAFVAQGISLGMTVASIFHIDIQEYSWVVQASTIPFAPMGVAGFALRYGSSSENERLRWTGIGLLEAAAFASLVGGLTRVALVRTAGTQDGGLFALPGMIAHFGASIAFVIAGGACLAAAKAQARGKGMSQSSRSPARPPHRGFVVPTLAPRHNGLSLGLVGVF